MQLGKRRYTTEELISQGRNIFGAVSEGVETYRSEWDWAPSWQQKQERRSLPEQVMEACNSNPEGTKGAASSYYYTFPLKPPNCFEKDTLLPQFLTAPTGLYPLLYSVLFLCPLQAPVASLWRCRQHGPPKCWYPITSLHGVATQMTMTWPSSPWKP
jgi:hypothetical protein